MTGYNRAADAGKLSILVLIIGDVRQNIGIVSSAAAPGNYAVAALILLNLKGLDITGAQVDNTLESVRGSKDFLLAGTSDHPC